MKNVWIYGDSSTWVYDSARYVPEADTYQRMNETERWPGLVRSLLGSDYHIIEDALNGRTLVWNDPYMPGRNGLKGLLDDDGKMKGSVLIMDFDSRSFLDEYLDSEPYIVERVWEKIEVEPMNVVIVNGEKVGR